MDHTHPWDSDLVSRVAILLMIPYPGNASCTTLVSVWTCEMVRSLVETSSLHCQVLFGPRKNQRCIAACANSAPDHDRLWMLAMFDNYRGTWSIYRPDHIVLGVMSLLDGKELLISEKESLPALTCGPSQKFSASLEPHEFVLFSEKLNVLELVRLQSKLCF
ncbi:hypothetical protein AVEN_170184-1 [Araneus ventricosus]|uniref:Uncharacterized protein n=1 Tax=Araneus ventricosus TaxID=182803 RepID=A0A4Y2MMS7_ARAVE|nr:hypothetical protein AVEN_213413-1 [Araneus ventricosus]GBN26936.1 hypothetical protein AVEN_91429-1 [Araneus ventricosus]GBN28607.1 hypothetical protein AVEN_44066-1 [Araneus ventricosus]GBN28608.1 hypothetical protein AVEN_170184-1 [Araneus ventricosus]